MQPAGSEPVREAFAAILAAEGADLSAQVAAYHHGEPVVDLWAGAQSAPDSLLGLYSASKGVAHLVVAGLVQDGVLDLDQKVTHYWPGFGVKGKGALLLRELLSHQAGLAGADTGFTMAELADDQLAATDDHRFLPAQPMTATRNGCASWRPPPPPPTASAASPSTATTRVTGKSGSCRTSR